MKIGRPRTLLGLTLVGLALVTLPLLVAIGNAAMQFARITRETGDVAMEYETTSLEGQRITNYLANLERNARQYIVIGDAELINVYDNDAAGLKESLGTLTGLAQTAKVAEQLERVWVIADGTRSALEHYAEQIGEADRSADRDALRTQLRNQFDEIVSANYKAANAEALQIREGMRLARNAQLAALQESTREAQQALMWQSLLLVPGTIVLILFFLAIVGRPMRQVDRAIRDLGSGDFSREIYVHGPRDIETLGRQLEWLRHRLKESTEEKNKFLRHMSHELKTPLANIREGTELLLDGSVGELDTQQQEVTSILRDNGLKLQQLIENLLNFSAWQTKTASLEISDFDLKPLVFSVLSQHRLLISSQKVKLQLNVSAARIRADEGKLRLVLENLISNAIKFLPNGGTIYVGAELRDIELVLEVADTGPGVAPEDRERIFEAFYQGRRLQGGAVGGTGIGLSVVSECVQAHGGTVQLIDSHWPGAHFHVRLPLRRTSDRPQLVVNA